MLYPCVNFISEYKLSHDLKSVCKFLGGIIPAEDHARMNEMGVESLFGPGTSTGDAVAYVRDWFATGEERV